jgi:hypothetical protein
MRDVDICERLRLAPSRLIGTVDEDTYLACHDAASEIARLRLTDEEREAFRLAAEWCRTYGGAVYDAGHAIDRFQKRTK